MARRRQGQQGHLTSQHKDLLAEVGLQVRQLGAQSVMTSQIIASRFALHTTDLECLDLIFLNTRVSAGELCGATGLTSGAMTALIDRLERAGYVRLVDDPKDRRRVLVEIRPEAVEPIEAVYSPIQKRMFALWSTYGAKELELIAEFLRKSRELATECAGEISAGAPLSIGRARRRASGS